MRLPIFLATLLLVLILSTPTNSKWFSKVANKFVGKGVGKAGKAAGKAGLAVITAMIVESSASALIEEANHIDTPREPTEESTAVLWLAKVGAGIDSMEQRNMKMHRHFADYTTDSITENMEHNIPIMAKMKDIHDNMNDISLRYKWMQIYGELQLFENFTLIRFAEDSLSAIHQIDRLHAALLGREDRAHATPNNLLFQLLSKLKGFPYHICKSQQSVQQFFYLLFQDIALTELKAQAMIEFSWLLLKQFERGEFTEEKRVIREGLKRRTSRTLKLFKDVISRADRRVWRCDPTYHTPGVTYEEVTRLLQGYIENEVDLNADGRCRYDCARYNYASNHGCYDNEFCSKQPKCSGRILNCQYVEYKMQVCQAPQDSTRRYVFVHYDSGFRLGPGGQCARHTDEANGWRRWIFWKCTYCMCLCDEQGPKSDRFFNLRPVTADVEHNRVVTGLRFVKHNRILHLQIQEGELLSKGVINQTTLHWKPLEEYKITDRNVRQGIDYHMLTYERRSIDLDELEPRETNSLITGLRFRNIEGHLHLEAQYSAFEFQSGKLIEPTKKSYWNLGPGVQGREKLPLRDTNMPTRTTASSTVLSSSNQYIDFSHTGFEKDVAQTTVPFIDIQDVVSNPPVPLSGIGIYYKGRPGYGGFLGPKIINLDFGPYLEVTKSKFENQTLYILLYQFYL
ncbi:uncharacterized protein [Drosophila kikkawai]|uniref:Uncharacterized protein n=1 Tax=Drosophila kikkawai TaxID=30033 RepID=A0A6P4JBW3_DROKI|nr:uncharacterized protein LOC108086053 [Drosophila kikkawai]